MLENIHIEKFLYLENIDIQLSNGLNVFTGETGVGKSLIIDAIDFVLGKKGKFQEGDYVELIFEDINNEFSEDSTLIVSRAIKNGKSQYFLNGRRATLSTILEATKDIIEIHGQYSQQYLFSKDYHRQILDTFANLSQLLKEYQIKFAEYTKIKKTLRKLKEKQAEGVREIEFLKFQLKELEEADLKENEKQELEERYEYLSSLKDIKIAVEETIFNLFNKEESVEEQISGSIKNLSSFASISKEINESLNYLEEAKSLVKEAFYTLTKIDFDIDEEELFKVEERLNLINNLEVKYKTDLNGLIKLKKQIKRKLENLTSLDNEIPNLEKKLQTLEKEVNNLANEISKIRKEKAKEFEKKIENHLKELALKDAKFVVDVREIPLNKYGKDEVIFLFSANSGIEPSLLSETASGGELSRISLALKLISNQSTDTVVFDEIDTGIGGKTAIFLAKKIKKLAENFQVLLITHLPQVAVFADSHYVVDKFSENGKTKAIVKKVSNLEREKELARMLSGIINEKSLEHARELINQLSK